MAQRLQVHGPDLIGAQLDGKIDGQVVPVAAVHIALVVDGAALESGITGRRCQQVIRHLPLGDILLGHFRGLQAGNLHCDNTEFLGRLTDLLLVQTAAHQLLQRADLHAAIRYDLPQGSPERLPGAVQRGEILCLDIGHHRFVVHIFPHVHCEVIVPLHHQRSVERADGSAGYHIKVDLQFPGCPPDSDLIGAAGTSPAQHQTPVQHGSHLSFP